MRNLAAAELPPEGWALEGRGRGSETGERWRDGEMLELRLVTVSHRHVMCRTTSALPSRVQRPKRDFRRLRGVEEGRKNWTSCCTDDDLGEGEGMALNRGARASGLST